MPSPNGLTVLLSKAPPKRRLRLRVTLMASIEYLATCAFLCIYWRLGQVDAYMVLGFLAYSIVANALILWAIGSGRSERFDDPSMTSLQMAVSCTRDLAGCFFMPHLWFIFAFNLFIALPFGSLQFSGRTFISFWLATCVGLGLIFATYPGHLQIGFDTIEEKVLLWTFISAALARLTMFNSHVSTLRRKLRDKAEMLDKVGRRLERERISRELHDTLLQANYGLIWRLGGLAQQIPTGDPMRGKLEAALEQSEELLRAARAEVFGLRTVPAEQQSLVDVLQAAGTEMAAERGMSFNTSVRGPQAPLADEVRANLERILREAISNAFQHSGGRSVLLEVRFTARALVASIGDDGRGIVDCPEREGRATHIGLSVMKERAADIGAKLTISCPSQGGTIVEIQVPADIAYARIGLSKKNIWVRQLLDRHKHGSVAA